MMEFSLTPEEFSAKVKELEQTQGVVLPGNEGTLTKMGVTASYLYQEGVLKVAILDKPFFVTTDYCEEQLRHWIEGTR